MLLNASAVAFRVDSSTEIGAGHLMRCLTLADHLRTKGIKSKFVCRDLLGHLANLVIERGHSLSMLESVDLVTRQLKNSENKLYPPEMVWSQQKDALDTLTVLNDESYLCIVVDHYSLDREWESAVRHKTNLLFAIDDLANRHHSADLILDQTLGRQPGDYKAFVEEYTTVLAGCDYVLLRNEFSVLRESLDPAEEKGAINELLISLGGTDPKNITLRVLRVLDALDFKGNTTVVLGGSAPGLSKVIEYTETSDLNIEVKVGVKNMEQHIVKADLAIGAAGTSTWERCCLGLPAITLVLAENQRFVASQLHKFEVSVVVEEENLEADLSTALTNLLGDRILFDRLRRNSWKICDGLGVVRVADYILNNWVLK